MSEDTNRVSFEEHREGRTELREWKEAQPDNAFTSDSHFGTILPLYADSEYFDELKMELRQFGSDVAGKVDRLVQQNNLMANRPRLNRYTGIGERTEEIEHHPTYHKAGEYIYGSGVMSAYADHPNSVGALSRFYISSYNGEAGHNCPIACTAGVIRVLQELASDELREKYLSGFLSRDYEAHLEGAQFLTEIQGGSDVGRNGTRARRADDGTWRLHGEKWFCSNIDADVFLMTARFAEDVEGTSGLGLFFVPRELDDGTVNEFEIRRLKEKIGTRSMASAECNFRGAKAYHMGKPENGFKNMMKYVINTSRLYNALACCGVARRAYVTAQTYAQHRSAFDTTIGDYALIQETLADMKAELDAMVSCSMHMAWLQDRRDAGKLSEQEEQFFRMALNLNKMQTAKAARGLSVKGIEVLGGNGAIETFSVLPRLLRDSIVTENWEGTHNTLQMQILRDMKKYEVQEGFFNYLQKLLRNTDDQDKERTESVRTNLREATRELGELQNKANPNATLMARPLLEKLGYLTYATIRLWERTQADDFSAVSDASIEHFLETKIGERPSREDGDYLDRINLLSNTL